MLETIWHLSRGKKTFLALFLLLFFCSLIGLFWNFYQENTIAFPAEGGRFTQGAVAVVDQNFVLNPLLITGTNKATSAEADISQLLFSGLMRFDAASGEVIDHLADHTLSEDKRTYTFTLKDDLTWHDGEVITADDVVFTFQTLIQHPEFPNAFLRQAFRDVVIEKIDDKTVAFTIPQAYKFFLTNFAIGLLPQHILQDMNPSNLYFSEFNQNPIGAGPYRFVGITQDDNSLIETISLEAFPEYIAGKPKIANIDFRLFANNELMLRNMSSLDALPPRLKSEYAALEDEENFRLFDFTIPQYVAVFLNMDRPIFNDDAKQKTRLALQLATDKDELLEAVGGVRIDTPLLETDTTEWLFEYDTEKAAGALKDSGWYLPGTIPEEAIVAVEESADTEEAPVETSGPAKYVYQPSNQKTAWTTDADDFILGTFPEGTRAVKVNGYGLNLFRPTSGRFSYKINTNIGTLKYGENVYKIEFFNASGTLLDSETFTLNLVNSADEIPNQAEIVAETEESTNESEESPPENTGEALQPVEGLPDTIRVNVNNEPLTLRMVTIENPSFYPRMANILKDQWEDVGIAVSVEVLSSEDFFQTAIVDKDYDLLLYGQNLGYNLDAFPFWHFSQAASGSNLSNYRSFEAGVLLSEIRQTHDEELRTQKLVELREIIKQDVPAVFLLSPVYTMPLINGKVKNFTAEQIALLPDRFSNVEEWYIRESRSFHPETSWFQFFPWFFRSVADTFSFSSS